MYTVAHMQYGFLIDHDRCIGCHACTVACKAENDVPVGNFRTWVKYVERGTFPSVRRHFAVLRCNHCTDAPCVTICPVNALEKRPDGIVDIDRDACIGCRACMQACPYDALYLNEDRGAVEKCHFCAHRVEKGLEPACAVVCPESAIIAGDVDNPETKISLLIANNNVQVRRAEQGTGPNVYYKGADSVALSPGAAHRPDTYIWSDRPPHKPEKWPLELALEQDATVVLDAGHRVEWGWHVSMYLVTKGIGAGAAMLAPFAAALGLTGFAQSYLPEAIALIFTLLTLWLLVDDLGKPWTFYRLMTRPNWKSWLVKGGIILGAFSATVSATIVLRAMGSDGAADILRWVNAALGIAVAGYTAFLFAQCKGRDLWENKGLLLPHLLVQAVLCGAVFFVAFSFEHKVILYVIAGSALLHGVFALLERFGKHTTTNAQQAAAFLGTVRFAGLPALATALTIGVLLTIAITFTLPELAAIPALLGLYIYEHAYIRAGQLPPLS